MRIAFFTNNYLPNPYGVAASLETFRLGLEKLNQETLVLAPYFPNFKDAKKNIYRYPALDINIKFHFPLAIPYSRKINKILSATSIDIIHSQHPNLLGRAALSWAKKKNIPLIFTWHTLYDRYTNFVPFLPKKLVAWWTIREAVKYANLANRVVIPTESIRPILEVWGVKTAMVAIPTGVEEEEFSNPEREVTREKLGFGKEEIVLLSLCRLTEEKNIDFLVESMVVALKNNPLTKGLIVGDGYRRKNLEKYVKKEGLEKRIIFAGVVQRENLKNYYAASDIFLQASESETQGMSLTEAMYMGLPIVAIDATGAKSLVEKGVNGFLTQKEEFLPKIQELLNNENLRLTMGKNSKRIAKEKYTAEISAKKMLALYVDTIGGFRGNKN